MRRLSKTDAANDVANKINEIIVSVRSKRCASVGKISTKELWAMVRGKGKVKHKHIYLLMVRLLIPVTLTNFLLVYPLIQITVCKGVRCPPIFSLSNLIDAGWL